MAFDSRLSQRSTSGTIVIQCPECGERREVLVRQAHRISKEGASSLCRLCRRPPLRGQPDESDLRFWLRWSGASLNGESAAEYVAEHGLPLQLEELIADLGLYRARR